MVADAVVATAKAKAVAGGAAVKKAKAAVAGGAVTTINPTYGAEEVRYQLLDAGASMLVTVAPFLTTALEAAEGTRAHNLGPKTRRGVRP